ncbi:MAG: hypothetical protein KKA19_04700 [Candidatus Margulisbacteria bacterium]|nr:hypothetical protein [Candidatus Margulisiibacteriota bacterium]
MRYTIKAYNKTLNRNFGVLSLFLPDLDVNVVEIKIIAIDENEAIGKARRHTREREYFDVIKIEE